MLLVRAITAILAFRVYTSNVNCERSGGYLTFYQDALDNLIENTTNGIGNNCRGHLNYFRKELGMHQMWAMQMFDASSKLPSGILSGNTADLGSFDECININRRINNSDYIRGRYCLGTTTFNINEVASLNTSFALQLASCLPHTCTTKDASIVYQQFDLNITFSNSSCQTILDIRELHFSAAEYCGIGFFATFALILAVSTIYDIYLQISESQIRYSILTSFSILKNSKKLIAIENNAKQITCINGIRVISTMWIILDHQYYIQFLFPLWNNFYKEKFNQHVGNMFILNSQIAVDTFFLLSGIMIAYVYLCSAEKSRSFPIFKFYLHRILRLTPVLVAVIVFIVTLLRTLASGPFWTNTINSQLIEGCEKFWWKTLLYIQNYDMQFVMCLPHGWYLSADMQLFIISPIFLLALSRWPKRAVCGVVALTVCNMIACFLIGWFFELNGIMQGNVDFKKQMTYVWQYYFPAYTRAAPWLIGIILGYYLYLSKKKKHELSMYIVFTVWIFSVAMMCAIAFGGHGLMFSEHLKVLNSIYLATSRPTWALAISGVIFLCTNDYGGPVNWFLSLPIFEVLSRLTYTMYITHFIVIFVLTSRMKTTVFFRHLEAMHTFWGDFAFTLAFSTLLTLSFEYPFIEIEKIIFAKRRTESTMTLEEGKTTRTDSSLN